MTRYLTAVSLAALIHASALAQDTTAPAPEAEAEAAAEATGWDVANPPLPTRDVTISVSEGTWMSLDVSPDGQTIAFDLLGDIYTMPITGGPATQISSGLPWEIQPRFSPDGSRIAFISDRGGGDNLWIMNPDGSDRIQVSNETFRLLNNPAWSPDGQYIAARKHFTTTRSAGTGEIWMYHVSGGSGVRLVERPSEQFQKELGEPVFSPDGRYVYYTQNVTPGNTFIYAQDSNTDLFNILRYELETGEIETAVSGAGGAVRPAPSPDGRYMAFVRRWRSGEPGQDRQMHGLWLKDLGSGEERRIYDDLDPDMMETWGVTGLYPNMDWMPDSSGIVFWAGGQIHRIGVDGGEAQTIPFQVNDTRAVIDPPRPQVEVAPATFQTRMPRFAVVSPNGGQVVFESLGRLYVMDAGGGTPQRLTRSDEDRRELFPTWSPDGRTLAFVTWTDDGLGTIRTIGANGRNERAVTSERGHYFRPRFSPDGQTLVFEKEEGGYLTSPNWSESHGVYTIPVAGGTMNRVTDNGSSPHFGASNDRVFMTRSESGSQTLVSVDLDGQRERTHATGEMATRFEVAPDGRHLAFRQNYDVYVMPMTPGPQNLSATSGGNGVPVTEVSGNGATYYHWSQDGTRLNWTMGPTLFTAHTRDMFADRPRREGEDAFTFTPPETGVSLSMTVTADRPAGVVALTGARIITMSDDEGGVIENGTIVIENNRILAVGAADTVEIPAGAQTIDAEGRTIVPGYIDAHAHGPQGTNDLIPQQNWSSIAHLAFGVTTIHDPSNAASQIFAAGEMQRAGGYLAPRLFSTGEIVYGARAASVFASIDDIDDARQHVFRLQAQGAHSIKNYNQPRRDQRQQVVAAAIEAGLAVVAEGGSNYHMDMALVADGNTSVEHNIPTARIYDDVIQMWSQTEVANVPTLVVTYGGMAADPYWTQAMDVWRHPILSQHVPPQILQSQTVRRTTGPEEDYVDDDAAAVARELADAGVMISIGAHGQREGLAAHWEMWSFVRGGWTPLQALQAATVTPARFLGFEADIGRLEPGMLADLVVLTANPLDDIGNTDDIEYVMINGRMYDPITMNEVVTGDAERSPYFWE
ncbi:MAG: amidohydrolase [Maricaulis sp.]|nr:amidohydrolase [Maricaulis sp.]